MLSTTSSAYSLEPRAGRATRTLAELYNQLRPLPDWLLTGPLRCAMEKSFRVAEMSILPHALRSSFSPLFIAHKLLPSCDTPALPQCPLSLRLMHTNRLWGGNCWPNCALLGVDHSRPPVVVLTRAPCSRKRETGRCSHFCLRAEKSTPTPLRRTVA